MKRISIIGAGRVGLVVAACFAKMGNKITVVDIDESKIAEINNKVSPIAEPGLGEILNGFEIEATSDYQKVIDSEAIFICVNTPPREDGSIALENIVTATEQIGKVLKRKQSYALITIKSTVVPGTSEEVILPILESSGKRAGQDFGLCMSPEFLRGGRGMEDFVYPARIIIGEHDTKAGDMLCDLCQLFTAPIMRTDLKTAEMIKYASNIFLATKISFINEIGNICKLLGIDVYEVARGMSFDDRIGGEFLNAGLGFGGPCLPKDLKGLIARAKEVGYEPKLLEEVLSLNERQALKVLELLKKHIPVRGSTIGLLGLAFKPGTDDIGDSMAITIAETLTEEGAKIRAYDPLAMRNFERLFPHVECSTPAEVLNCDAVIIATEWEEFNTLDYEGKIVIDGRRVPRARDARIYEGICW
jgi:UDPglucose 6-dehydrogenase